MKENTILLGLHAKTSIAAGTGQNLGAVDLPIMREAPTGYPVVFGSALKGAMREKFEREKSAEEAKVLFGDDSEGGSQYAGALIVSDARLLLLPVRSMTTHFRWVTCPYILRRFKEDMALLGKNLEWSVPRVDGTAAITHGNSGDLYLEEFKFAAKADELAEIIETISGISEITDDALQKQLVIVSDDMFSHLSQFATPVNAHIAIDNATKTVKRGALWYEETLPSETLLYVLVIANASRKEGDQKNQAKILKERVAEHMKAEPFVQVGGNETVGMGWCKAVCHG